MRRSRQSGSKPEQQSERDADDADRARYSATASPTGTSCPVDGCRCPQWRCPAGLTCDNGHGGADEGEPIATVVREQIIRARRGEQPPRPSFDPETGECGACGGSGFTGHGTGYGDVCGECGGQSAHVRPPEEVLPPKKPRQRLARGTPREMLASLSAGSLDGIVEQIFAVDPSNEFDRLQRALKIDERVERASYARLANALNEAEDSARAAHLLLVHAKDDRESFEIDALIITSDMRAQALGALENEKKRGGKPITEKDVEARIASMFPSDHRELSTRRKRVELSVEHLQRLADLWKDRCKTLNTLLQTKR
jgi:hypothetical protein